MKICAALLYIFLLLLAQNCAGRRRHERAILSTTEEDLDKRVPIVVVEKHLNQEKPVIHHPHPHRNSSSEALDDDEEMDDPGDSDVSEERNEDDLINDQLSPVHVDDAEQRRPDDIISVINSAFKASRKTFQCPKIKTDFVTGTSMANLSPEDIGVIAAMGDSLATGSGLWPRTDIEFRGAAFPIGGDATIDGLVTIPNILREFSPYGKLAGVSHGMGLRDQLPEIQLNVAMSGASSSSMPQQATELVRRIRSQKIDVYRTWAMIIITIGTEEICSNCTAPNTAALKEALDILDRGIPRAFVILLGPIHVSSAYNQKANLLKDRCACSRTKASEFLEDLSKRWADAFEEVQLHVTKNRRKTFGLLALPMLTVTSRYPYSLFIPNKPLLNRRGHTYATKFLWNRLISGPKYNLANAILSEDDYFCPSLGCPYFRTVENYKHCKILSYADAREIEKEEAEKIEYMQSPQRKVDLYITAVVIISLATVTALTVGAFFYRRSKHGAKGRYDQTAYNFDIIRSVRAASTRRKIGRDSEKEAFKTEDSLTIMHTNESTETENSPNHSHDSDKS